MCPWNCVKAGMSPRHSEKVIWEKSFLPWQVLMLINLVPLEAFDFQNGYLLLIFKADLGIIFFSYLIPILHKTLILSTEVCPTTMRTTTVIGKILTYILKQRK